MTTKFGRQYPVLGRKSERERILVIAAASLAVFLLLMLFLLFNSKDSNQTVAHNEAEQQAAQTATLSTVTLLAPERRVEAGTLLSQVPLREVYWPRAEVPEGAIRDRSEVAGMYAKADMAAGIPLKRADLTQERADFVLPVSPGNRAVSIEVDAVTGIEGHAAPGTRVDVVLTYYEAGELTSKVIVENTRVLSLGGDTTLVTERGDIRRRGRAAPSRTITLEVAPQDALKMQTARKLGSLSLIMRASGDNRPVQKREFSGTDLGEGGLRNSARSRCERGTVRIPGKGDFILNCDGSMVRVPDPSEPLIGE